ncbi:hypothetical protein BRADI_4g28955v3 [Brachypodium distachyon]|uniref:Uncharacterized protein n=1 Tax=Brachypodium distachyon TaxID=15368 RepID=A0A2K2CR09_BRADI|nr:hypothetical protein BRADI_4g28955v3 [Brachypodium distachyon]
MEMERTGGTSMRVVARVWHPISEGALTSVLPLSLCCHCRLRCLPHVHHLSLHPPSLRRPGTGRWHYTVCRCASSSTTHSATLDIIFAEHVGFCPP